DINGFAVALTSTTTPPVCTPESTTTTCSGKCGTQTNNCGTSVSCGACQSTPTGTDDMVVLYYNNFEQNTIGTDDYKDDWYYCQVNPQSSIYRNVSDQNSTKIFRQVYPKGSVGLNDTKGFHCDALPTGNLSGRDELYLTYKVKFASDFNPVLGGKMPRLEGRSSLVSYESYTGNCPNGTDFFTSGMMFKSANPGIYPVFYLYYPDQWNAEYYRNIYFNKTGTYATSCDQATSVVGHTYGTTLYWNKVLTPGQWYTVTERIVLNTPGQKNGFVEGFIDGKLVAQYTGYRFRDIDSFKINWLDFTGFFGGSGAEWAPVKDEYNYYDDVMVYYYTSGSGEPTGSTLSSSSRILPIKYPTSSVLSGSATVDL
ncbi:MAG TPA: hypothetical protein VK153_03365, partial [Candidatus Paceibacterota bacterium]|nr:hypothetical protein [Candidatus Paceibacterota bacterium]